jgi:MFS family permease
VSIRQDLGISVATLGVAIGTYFLAMSLFSAPFGSFVQRIGWPLGMRASALVVAASLASIGFLVGSPVGLTVALAFSGLSHAVGQPAVNWALSANVDPRRQALVFAAKQSSVPIAILLAGVAVPAVALTVGWRWAYRGAAALALLLVVAVPGGSHGRSAAGLPRQRTPRPSRRLVLLGLSGMFGAAASASLAGFIVTSSVERGLAESTAGRLVAVGSLAGIAVRIGIGLLTDRADTDGTGLLAALLAAGSLGMFLVAPDVGGLQIVAPLLAFATVWGWQGAYVYAIVHRHRDAAATATGFGQSIASAGGAAGPVVFGWIAAGRSFTFAWLVAAVWLVGAAVLATVGRRRSRPGIC